MKPSKKAGTRTASSHPLLTDHEKHTRRIHRRVVWLIFILSFAFYGNTLWNEYSMDDELVVQNHPFVAKGLSGIPEIFTNRYAMNEKQNYDYRPIVVTTFAIEHQLFGENVAINHLVNVLLYALTGVVLYFLLLLLFQHQHWILPALSTFLFLIHPIHTEVVASLKNRDEILSLLFALLSLRAVMLYGRKGHWKYVAFGIGWLLLSLLSKRGTMTMFAVIPVTVWFFTEVRFKRLVPLFFVGTVSWLFFRVFMRRLMGVSNPEIREFSFFENPMFIQEPGVIERLAIAFHTTGYYFLKLIVPYPLAVYYGYDTVPLGSWSDPLTWLSTLAVLGGLGYALYGMRRRSIPAFAILYFLITISVCCNFVVPAVGIVADRFAYVPSVGFSILVAWLLLRAFKISTDPAVKLKVPRPAIALLGLLLLVSSVYTIHRNTEWKSALSIYRADIEKVPNSAKLNSLLGATYTLQLEQVRTGKMNLSAVQIRQKADSALFFFKRAVEIDPTYTNVYNNLGTVFFSYYQQPDSARKYLHEAVRLDTGYARALLNLGSVYEYDRGKYDLMESVLRKGTNLEEEQVSGNAILPDSAKFEAVFDPLVKLENALLSYVNEVVYSPTREAQQQNFSSAPQTVDNLLATYWPAGTPLKPSREKLTALLQETLYAYLSEQASGKPEGLVRYVLVNTCAADFTAFSRQYAGDQELVGYALRRKAESILQMLLLTTRSLERNSGLFIAYETLAGFYREHGMADSLLALSTRMQGKPGYRKEQLLVNIGMAHLMKQQFNEAIRAYLDAITLNRKILSRLGTIYNQMSAAGAPQPASYVYSLYTGKMNEIRSLYEFVARQYHEHGDVEVAQQFYTESLKYKL